MSVSRRTVSSSIVRQIPAEKMPRTSFEYLLLRLSGLSNAQAADHLGISIAAGKARLKRALDHTPENIAGRVRRGGGMTRAQADVLRLRLKELTYEKIGKELGVTSVCAGSRLTMAKKFLHPKTIERLNTIEGVLRRRSGSIRSCADIFMSELAKRSIPRELKGIRLLVAETVGISSTVVPLWLTREGINYFGEIQRKRFEFSLLVKATMKKPSVPTAEELGVTRKTLRKYRRQVEEGSYLTGVIEVRASAEDMWWRMPPPEICEGFGSGRVAGEGRINLSIRGETIARDLRLIKEQIREARDGMVNNHPDTHPGDKKALERFKVFSRRKARLHRSRSIYIAREKAFREKYCLPQLAID
ncbi:MAG: hypothetical protein ABIE84_03270 [bacterium]